MLWHEILSKLISSRFKFQVISWTSKMLEAREKPQQNRDQTLQIMKLCTCGKRGNIENESLISHVGALSPSHFCESLVFVYAMQMMGSSWGIPRVLKEHASMLILISENCAIETQFSLSLSSLLVIIFSRWTPLCRKSVDDDARQIEIFIVKPSSLLFNDRSSASNSHFSRLTVFTTSSLARSHCIVCMFGCWSVDDLTLRYQQNNKTHFERRSAPILDFTRRLTFCCETSLFVIHPDSVWTE